MLTLAASSGSKSYELDGRASTPEQEEKLFFNAVQLLEAQGESSAAETLKTWNFHLYHGGNEFADEFMVLHAELLPSRYVFVKKCFESDPKGDWVRDFKLIQQTFGDLNIYVRFVSCAPKHEEPPPAWRKGESMTEVGRRKNYALEPAPLGRGGYAEVYRATEKSTGNVVAFKRALDNDDESVARLRREIEEQSKLDHPHVMPILDHSVDFDWFTMPCAAGDLDRLRSTMDEPKLIDMLDQAAQGLAAAHEIGLVHRDVTPRNILALDTDGGSWRWVVADWGLVRRPPGMTTVVRTAARQSFGTDGFAAPELWDNAHAAGPEADVYGLGRVAAWAVTGEWPRPNIALVPVGPWRRLVQLTTEMDRPRRVPTMAAFRGLLGELRERESPAEMSPLERANGISQAVAVGSGSAIEELLSLVLAHPDEPDFYVEHLPRIPHLAVAVLVRSRPTDIKCLLTRTYELLTGNNWTWSFESTNGPLRWIESVARCAADSGDQGLLEDAASYLFEAEARWQRFAQRHRTRAWLETIGERDAQTVARALGRFPAAADWYMDEGWHPRDAHPLIRRSLGKA